MLKTIVISLLIIITVNYIIHFVKSSFTKPIVQYIDKVEVAKVAEVAEVVIDPNELSNFLKMQIDIKNNFNNNK